MSRAELRREKRENEKKSRTFVMTAEELDKVRHQEFDRAKKILMDKNDELAEAIDTFSDCVVSAYIFMDFD